MREQIERRLRELKLEYETGEKQLAQLKQRKEDLEGTLLRISGAILVLQELQDLQDGRDRPGANEAPAAQNGATAHADVA